MKKIVLGSLLMCAIFFVFSKVSAQNTNTEAIFKIQGYTYDKISDMYILQQYGSAVLIADNILLTNAHVVTDDNGTFTLQYEACQTISEQEPPKCFSTLQLLKYDKTADLALLQIINPSDSMPAPVTMGSGTLEVGSNIRIIGYPANGGQTITTTQGTIAGFERGYYKTDANVDEGNSGGGSFNNADQFIGIPTFVINGQTTLGYIIPTDTIKSFINGDIGTTYKTKYSVVFDKRIKSIYTQQGESKIDNNLFTTPDFNEIGLTLELMIEKKTNNIYTYSFINKNDSMVDMVSLIATDNSAITKYINNTMKQLRDAEYNPKKSTKKIGNTSRTVISFGDTDWVGYDYIQTNSTNKTYIEFTVLVDKEDIASDLADLIDFVESTTIKKSSLKPQPFNLPIIKLSSKRDVGIVKWMKRDGMSLTLYPTNGKYVTEVFMYIGDKGDTLKNITSQLRDFYESMDRTVKTETSKYPSSMTVTSVVDDNDNTTLEAIGYKKYGASNLFVHIGTTFTSISAKQEAINLGYKILGLE